MANKVLGMHRLKNNFNSIKVRLELTFRTVTCLRLKYFNSIKVRLELADSVSPEDMNEISIP